MSIAKDTDTGRSAGKWVSVGLLGCFSVAALAMVVLIALSFLVPRAVNRTIEAYTDTQPEIFEAPEMDTSESEALHDRLDRFEESLDEGTKTESLSLSEDELNFLLSELAEEEDVGGSFHVDLRDGQVAVHMSVPLEQEISIGPWERSLYGRYLNGVATFDVGIEDGDLDLDLVSFDVKGRSMPGWALNLVRDFIEESGVLESDDVLEVTRKLDRLEIQGDRVLLRAATP